MQWLRRSFVTGFFVTVPLFISVAAFIWIFNVVDGLTTPLYDRVLGRRIPGLGTASTALVIVLVRTARPTRTDVTESSALTLTEERTAPFGQGR